jgi:hypothetical protein
MIIGMVIRYKIQPRKKMAKETKRPIQIGRLLVTSMPVNQSLGMDII